MRLFLGINLSLEIKDSIHRYLKPMHLSPKGWENPHDYHQTLLFIGEVSEETVSDVLSRMDLVEGKPFTIKTSGIRFFNRRIMFLGIRESEDLKALKNKINGIFPEWASKETKSFLPHITIKRWQRYEYDHLEKSIAESPVPEWEIEVKGLSLFKSEKNHLNQKYHELKFVPFKD